MEQFSDKIIKSSAIVSAGNLLTKFIGFGSTFVIIYVLSVYEYGLYKLVFAAFGLLASFLFAGVDNVIVADAAVYRGRGYFDKAKRLFVEYFIARFVLGIILWFLAFFLADLFAKFYNQNITYFLKIVSFLFLINPFKSLISFLFRIELKFFYDKLLNVLEETIKLIFILFFFFSAGKGIDGVILAYVLAAFLSTLILFVFGISFLRNFWRTEMSFGFVLPRIIRGHGKWGILTTYNLDIQRNIHPFLIQFFLGTEAVALISIAQSLIGHTISLFPLAEVLIPAVPREIDDKERLKRIFSKGIKYSTIIFIAMAIAAFFITPYLLKFAFPKYLSSLSVFNILLFSVLFTGLANVLTSFFYAFKMQKNFFFISVWRFIFMFSASLILFPLFGLRGVAIQIVITQIFFVLMRRRDLIKTVPEISFSFKEFLKFDSYDAEVFKKIKIFLKSKIWPARI